MSIQEAFICAAVRTPIGNFQGGLSSLSAVQLGSCVIEAVLAKTGIASNAVGECLMGSVLQGGLGQAPARQAWIGGGGSEDVPCTTVNRVCGSGMQAIVNGARAISLGEYGIAMVGGMESMSGAMYALPKARRGYQLGVPSAAMIDLLIHDGLWDPYNNLHMGNLCEQVVAEHSLSRDAQDAYAVRSYTRALDAQRKGVFSHEIVPVTVTHKKGETIVADDEGPGLFDERKLRALRPAFDPRRGTITAGNASSINDGAAALLLAGEKRCETADLTPIARIVDWAVVASSPALFPLTPILAIEKILAQTGLAVSDIDCIEINEAFSAVPLFAIEKLKLDEEKVNPLGGAVALGHPIGASGARLVATLLSSLKHLGGKRGLATLCIGGGEGIALLVEMV
ncbi:MAG: thiolase family protein [Deltaproteobacteria bacterium]|nr:thiolase family protein [Deltaproteobacteria bacterium]MBN2672480.1 thiolase family protein [Deltaproteobacteria bacterium]